MKKVLSLILVCTLVFSLTLPAFCLSPKVSNVTPVVYIAGDSNRIAYDNGTKSFQINDLFSIFGDSEDGSISEAAFNILYPFIMEGIVFDKWDNYYDAVYKELADVYEPIRLDENGNAQYGTGLLEEYKRKMAADAVTDRKNAAGRYEQRVYEFYYDWRLDPIEIADRLNDYIEAIKNVTHSDKVSIIVKCLGNNVLLAYVDKYGTDSIKGVGIDVATSLGADFMTGMLTGKFGIDGNSVTRTLLDLSYRNNELTELAEFVGSTIDMLDNMGVLDSISTEARELIYGKIEYGVISAIALSAFMTMPGYWGIVSYEEFDTALNYVFGEEGSEKRQEYAGLIEKITKFNDNIKANTLPIMKSLETNGVNVCVISKYGLQMLPVLKDGSLVGDEYVSAQKSSFGATTSTIYGTLSDEYIAQRVAEGKGKYISPDKQIDASTCLFPDYTWFIKGEQHGWYAPQETDLLMTVMDADRQLTTDDFDFSQYLVISYDGTETLSSMTEENCHNELWKADDKIDHPQTKKERLISFLTTLFRWIKSLFALLTAKLKG